MQAFVHSKAPTGTRPKGVIQDGALDDKKPTAKAAGFFYFQQFEHRSRIVGKEKSRETTAGWLAFYPLLGLTGKRPKGVIQDETLIPSSA